MNISGIFLSSLQLCIREKWIISHRIFYLKEYHVIILQPYFHGYFTFF